MIQRKQTLYLLVAVILGMVHFQSWALFALQILASAVCLYDIFLYRRRPLQAGLCLVSIAASLVWYVVLAVQIHTGTHSATLPLTAALPMVVAILCVLARRAILSDERLVRAADRLR